MTGKNNDDLAREMGERAARRFLAGGVMPRCPFINRHALALAWFGGLVDVLAPALRRTSSKEPE